MKSAGVAIPPAAGVASGGRGRILTFDDYSYYRKIVLALGETIRLMAEIDSAIVRWPVE